MHQQPPQFANVTCWDGFTGYRYPAPGSTPKAAVPRTRDQLFDSKKYTRDNRNVPVDNITIVMGSKGPMTVNQEVLPHVPSKDMKIPAVSLYDPSGLRNSTTASWAEFDKAIEAQARPTHLPKSEWVGKEHEIFEACQRKGIPFHLGRPYKFHNVPPSYNKLKW